MSTPRYIAAEMETTLSEASAAADREYYEPEADRAQRDRYYGDLDRSTGQGLTRDLTALLQRTHSPQPSYVPMRHVYPWVDLHPDRLLRSIYSGKSFTAQQLIEADAEVAARREARRAVVEGSAEAAEEAIEQALPYNCEHVVPQSWFEKKEPMRGDLHHLFACESGCNSFRGNYPYFAFPARREALRNDCGRREDEGFEPSAGHGPVARATMYFLLRYPGLVGDEARELQRERIGLLLEWHERDEVSEYELHRNSAIAAAQGNRNPLIDLPDLAREIDFASIFGDGTV